MNKQFSILITTRERITMLHNLLKSIYDSTFHKDEVEIRIIYDLDDIFTDNYVKHTFSKEFKNNPPIETFFHVRKRSPNLVDDYHNWCSMNFAQGKYIIFSNDDALFEMTGWDDRASNTLKEFEKQHPDGICYGITEDFEHEPHRNAINWMACFPLVSKKAIEVLGFAFDPIFIRDGADWALAATFRNVNRIVNLRDCIIIKHLSLRSGRRKRDVLDDYAHSLGIAPPDIKVSVRSNASKLQTYLDNYYK